MHKISIILTDITKRAGTERAVVNLANILSSLNYDVCIFSTDSISGSPQYYLNRNVIIFHFGLKISSAKGFSKILEYKKLNTKIIECIKNENIDCVIGTYSFFNALLTRIPNVETIGCEHFNYFSASKLHRLVRRIFYPKLNAVVVLTEHDKAHYSFLKNCFVIPNSLSFESFIKENWSEKVVLSIGRYTKQKGFDFLIKTAAKLKKTFPDWKFKIVGSGENEKLLENLIAEYHLEDYVKLLPPTNNIVDLYKSASIYCMSSRYEGLPMVLLEAKSCGLSIVSFDCPEGPAEVIENNKDGFLCKPENPDDLAEKLKILMSDEKLREQFGKTAYVNSKRFSTENIAKKWKQLLERI